MSDYIVMQMIKTNREKGYCNRSSVKVVRLDKLAQVSGDCLDRPLRSMTYHSKSDRSTSTMKMNNDFLNVIWNSDIN